MFGRLSKKLFGSIKLEADATRHVQHKPINIDLLVRMFENISKTTNWDMNGPMLWGYFFTHKEPTLLEKAKDMLTSNGYRFVDIHLSDKKDKEEPNKWWLHVEKEEIHTPQTLDSRNDDLYMFAVQLGLDSYDGMDVGPIK